MIHPAGRGQTEPQAPAAFSAQRSLLSATHVSGVLLGLSIPTIIQADEQRLVHLGLLLATHAAWTKRLAMASFQ